VKASTEGGVRLLRYNLRGAVTLYEWSSVDQIGMEEVRQGEVILTMSASSEKLENQQWTRIRRWLKGKGCTTGRAVFPRVLRKSWSGLHNARVRYVKGRCNEISST
jgi:hypothetical protein